MTILQLQLSGKTFICLNKKYEEKTIVYNCILANFMYSATPEFFACLLTPPEKNLPLYSATGHQKCIIFNLFNKMTRV